MKHKSLEILKSKKDEPAKAILYIDDELSFINASQIKDDLLAQMKDFEHLSVQANIAHLDLTGVQLIYAIRKTCALHKKQVSYNIKMSEDLRNLLSRSGFKEILL